jgi:hypothetical protein
MNGKAALRPRTINMSPLNVLNFGLFIAGSIVETKVMELVAVIIARNISR